MADDDQDAARPNLEPPKLFGRRRQPDDSPQPELDLPPEAEDDPAPETGAEPVLEVEETPDLLPELDLPPEPDQDAEEIPPAVEPFSDPTWMFELPDDDTEPEPTPAVLPAEAGTPLFADEVEETSPPPVKGRRQRAAKESKQPKQPKQPRKPRVPALPTVTGWVAAAITGILIGLLLVGMTAGSLQGCEAVRGTSTCGGWGVPLLILIMAILIALGGLLLRLFRVPDPGSTSFLALGMVAVISLLFLLDVLENWWMVIVIPVVSAAMYLLGYWVTTAFVEPAKEPAEQEQPPRRP